jgi:hypothetical protein
MSTNFRTKLLKICSEVLDSLHKDEQTQNMAKLIRADTQITVQR